MVPAPIEDGEEKVLVVSFDQTLQNPINRERASF